MSRVFVIESLAFGVLLSACGGESSNAGGDTGNATGGGSGSMVGDISGDFWIQMTESERYYLTVVSPTQALVGRPFGPPVGYAIEYHRRAALGSEVANGELELSGEYVLFPNPPEYGKPEFALALALGAGDGDALVAEQSIYCHGNGRWTVTGATLVKDTTPTEVRVPEVLAPPWAWLSVFGERVFSAPLAGGIEVRADGAPISVTWYDVDMGLGVGVGGVLGDWRSSMGQTLEFFGSVTATNGVDSPVTTTLPVIDFGLHAGRVSFENGIPEGVARWGTTTHYVGGPGSCPDGCVQLSPGGGIGVRLENPGPILRVVSTANNMNVLFALPGGSPVYATLPPGDGVNLVVADIPITSGLSDIFVAIEGPLASNPSDPCSSQPFGLVASIEAAP